LERWHAAVKLRGPAGPERKRRSDRGCRRASAHIVVALAEGLALIRPRRSIATIHRTLVTLATVAAERGWARRCPTASFRSILAGLDPSMVTLAQDRPVAVAYRDTYELIWRLRADSPNAVWQVDHTGLDILIRAPGRQPARPWLTVVLEEYSAPSAVTWSSWAPRPRRTALALCQAIWPKSVAG